ncbi:hypothetical protein GGI35DRAFT_476750 [Trichoderma velutinum]
MSSSLPWGMNGLDKSRFEAYAKLLRLKNGGQIEPTSDFSELHDEGIELDKSDDTDSANANVFPLFDERKLKRAFLDRLSELIANEKGGRHVSSSLMIEWPDRVDILVARNNGFRGGDVILRMLDTIASSLRDISMLNPVAAYTKQNLWTSLVQFYKPRLDCYISRVKEALKKCIPPTEGQVETLALGDRTPSLISHLEEIRALINGVVLSPTQTGLEEVVKSSHNVFSLYNEHDFIEITSNTTDTKSLRDALGFLGRLQTCFNTLIRSSERHSGFQNLRILPVIGPSTSANKPKSTDQSNVWSLTKTFSSLGIALDDKTVASLVGTGKKKGAWTKTKLLQKFDKLKSSVSEVHAEIQVILAATKHDCTGATIFKYVGCSKRSCFLCFKLIQNYGSYTTRGCHGKLYDLWTVPECSWLTEEEDLKLVQALKKVERAMKECICDRKTDRLVHANESTIGGSSVATRIQQFGQNAYTASLIFEHLRSQSQGMRSSADKVHILDPRGSSQPLSSGAEYEARVDSVWHDKRMVDPREQHQRLNSSEVNATFASKRLIAAVKSASWIGSAVKGVKIRCHSTTSPNQFPQDPEICEHFGFARCRSWREQSHLLGLYKGLLILNIGPIQLNTWREKDILVSKIIETFSKVPEQRRGSYFPWFLRNQHILDSSLPPHQLRGEDNPLRRAIDAAKPLLNLEDRNKEFQQLEPLSKRHCFLFYAIALDGGYPNPCWAEVDLWYDFGFVVCQSEHGEEGLGILYSRLVGANKTTRDCDESLGTKRKDYFDGPTCSFDEFWLAYENGSLARLFEQYGFGGMIDRYLGLQEFLAFPRKQSELRPSVWRLKHFLALDPNTPLGNFPDVEAAAHEYGFTSHLNAVTRLALRQFYEQLLRKAHPLRVHDAKSCGKLLEYAESCMDGIDDGVRHVLRQLS